MSNLAKHQRDMFIQTSRALNESQTCFRKDGLWFVKMGHWKGKQIIYSCVDLVVVFVPLVTLPFEMSKDLIWAVSKCTTWRERRSYHCSHTALTYWDGSFKGSKFSISFSCKLFTNIVQVKGRNGFLDRVKHLGVLEGEKKKAEHLLWAEVGGHVWWWTSESQESERER